MQTDLDALIQRASESDTAAEELFVLLYDELHRLAEHTLRRDGGALTLGTTTLLHEAYLKVAGREGLAFDDRKRFFAYAARAMRSLVIDYARQRRAIKRGTLVRGNPGRRCRRDGPGGRQRGARSHW